MLAGILLRRAVFRIAPCVPAERVRESYLSNPLARKAERTNRCSCPRPSAGEAEIHQHRAPDSSQIRSIQSANHHTNALNRYAHAPIDHGLR